MALNGEPLQDTARVTDLNDRMLGEFRLLRRLGRGGMADVYLAEQTSLGRQVAVKVLRAERLAGADDVLLQRFTHEAKAAAALSHPNIVQVYVIGEQDGTHYIAQEYVQGLNLREFLQKKGPPNLPLALHVMKQVASALHRAAEAGIVHRDIKPENIMITRQGVAKVADFGLAQLTLSGERVNLTQIGVTMGTPLYMSPEQVHGDKLDQRSDIYSFGVSCYQMLAGNPPYRGETALSVAMQHVNGKPEPLGEIRPDLPPALCQIVHRMMARRPEDRYPDAQALLRDLKRVEQELRERPETAGQFSLGEDFDILSGGSGSWAERILRWPRGRRLAAYAAACLVALLFSAAIGWLLRPDDPLQSEARSPEIVRARTAQEQFDAALLYYPNEVEHWQAVIDHPSADESIRRRAQEQLGLLFLRKLSLDEAEQVFGDLAEAPDDEEYQATGLAGLAVIASLRGHHEQSQRLIAEHELEPMLRERRGGPDVRGGNEDREGPVLRGEIAPYLNQAIERNREKLPPQTAVQRSPERPDEPR